MEGQGPGPSLISEATAGKARKELEQNRGYSELQSFPGTPGTPGTRQNPHKA